MHKEREKCQKRENNNLAIKVKHLCSSSRAVDNVEPCPVSGLIHAETPSGGEVDCRLPTSAQTPDLLEPEGDDVVSR